VTRITATMPLFTGENIAVAAPGASHRDFLRSQ
jgi:hypothetical protein